MSNNYTVCIYWGNQRKEVIEYSILIHTTVKWLQSLDESFSRWYPTERPKKSEILTPLELNADVIVSSINKGKIYIESIPPLYLGFTFTWKSEKKFEMAHRLSFSGDSLNESFPNSVVLEINDRSLSNVKAELLLKILNKFIEIWKPEYGVIDKDSSKEKSDNLTINGKKIGIINYLSTAATEFETNTSLISIGSSSEKGSYYFFKDSEINISELQHLL